MNSFFGSAINFLLSFLFTIVRCMIQIIHPQMYYYVHLDAIFIWLDDLVRIFSDSSYILVQL